MKGKKTLWIVLGVIIVVVAIVISIRFGKSKTTEPNIQDQLDAMRVKVLAIYNGTEGEVKPILVGTEEVLREELGWKSNPDTTEVSVFSMNIIEENVVVISGNNIGETNAVLDTIYCVPVQAEEVE